MKTTKDECKLTEEEKAEILNRLKGTRSPYDAMLMRRKDERIRYLLDENAYLRELLYEVGRLSPNTDIQREMANKREQDCVDKK